MAKTIDHLTLTVGVTAYEHEGCQYDALLMIVAYKKGRGFCVSWQPVKLTGYGYQTGPMPSSDPLVMGGGFVVKEATKNNVKTLEQMRTNLEAAAEGIMYYFDERDFAGLKKLMGDVANYGYPYNYEQKIKQLINSKNNTTMATKNMAKNESANVQATAQVNNNAPIEDVNVGEVTLDSIQPVMVPVEGSEYQVKDDGGNDVTFSSVTPNIGAPTKQEVAEAIVKAANEGKATTMPLGSHGTLVIAGVGGEKPKVTLKRKVTLKTKQPEQAPETISRVRLVTFTTKRGDTAPRIVGFTGEDDPRWKPIYDEKQALVDAYNKAKKKDPKAKMTSSPFGPAWLTDRETGEKTYCMTFGVKYMDAAKALCEAYNTNDRAEWKRAEQAVRDTKAGIVSGYQAEKAARRAEREAQRAAKAVQEQPSADKTYTRQEVAALLQRVLNRDAEALAEANAMMKAA